MGPRNDRVDRGRIYSTARVIRAGEPGPSVLVQGRTGALGGEKRDLQELTTSYDISAAAAAPVRRGRGFRTLDLWAEGAERFRCEMELSS